MPNGHSKGIGVEKKEETNSISKQDESVGESSHPNEGESRAQADQANDTYTTVTPSDAAQTSGTIALITIPVYLKNGTNKSK